MKAKLTAWTLTMVVIAGCGGSDPLDPNGPRRNVATQLGGMPPDVTTTQGTSSSGQPAKGGTLPPPPPPPPSPDTPTVEGPTPPPPGTVRVRATGHEGKRGQGYGTGPIATPVAAYFTSRGQIKILQIRHTLKIYKAEHEGAPKTHEEFMEKIIEAYQLSLPELPRGHRYLWDPEKEELMVERPRR